MEEDEYVSTCCVLLLLGFTILPHEEVCTHRRHMTQARPPRTLPQMESWGETQGVDSSQKLCTETVTADSCCCTSQVFCSLCCSKMRSNSFASLLRDAPHPQAYPSLPGLRSLVPIAYNQTHPHWSSRYPRKGIMSHQQTLASKSTAET